MFTIFIAFVLLCLLAAKAETLPTERCSSVLSNTCLQKCNTTSCSCGRSDGKYAFTECNQACGGAGCRKIKCSAGTCYQHCHNCQMECTSDVEYCSQQCLSGACSFKCSAKRCVQECDGKKCEHLPSGHEEPFIPRLYLVILAGLFAATTVLTCLALVLSCSQMGCWRKKTRPFRESRTINNSISSVPIKSQVV